MTKHECYVCGDPIGGRVRYCGTGTVEGIAGAWYRHPSCKPYTDEWTRRFPTHYSSRYMLAHPKTEAEKQALRERFRALAAKATGD